MKTPRFSAIILAGGIGARVKKNTPKQFLLLAGRPIVMHTLERLEQIEDVKEIILVCLQSYIETMQELIVENGLQKPYTIIAGGATRQESVLLGLRQAKYDHVLIHEAVRPFVTTENFRALLAHPCENTILGFDIPFTVLKRKGDYVSSILTRSELVNVQLPHKFERRALLDAHEKAHAQGQEFTEDASLLFYYTGCEIAIQTGFHYNLKITQPVDLVAGEIIYQEYIHGNDEQ